MKVNSSTFLCTLPHFQESPPDDNTTSLSHADEEKERHRARKKGWELLRPLEGNCMFYVPLPPSLTLIPEYWMVDLCILSQPLRKTIPCPSPWKCHPLLSPRRRPRHRILHPRPNPGERAPQRRRTLRPAPVSTR